MIDAIRNGMIVSISTSIVIQIGVATDAPRYSLICAINVFNMYVPPIIYDITTPAGAAAFHLR